MHVKDFMIRHQKLLGLKREDVQILEQLRTRDIQLIENMQSGSGFSWHYYMGER